ncbi:dTDP-4-keto-6-deoxy-D-glucose epimerase, partial [Yimella sp. RIT 621]|uniref:dTDP-4-dehydrorhamnose 3,5-epimerase family protein n=1 Tax=Yimella sp. RIT 621 TaxID=2510323 RepID=UPI00101D87A0
MNIEPLAIEGAYVITPRQFPDDRGVFMEGFRADKLAEHLGHQMQVLQTNISVSSAGTVRGIHYADVPPSQAKYITAASGALIDYIIDIRVGSPTYGEWDCVLLDSDSRKAVYLSEGLGHAFCALQDDTTAVYLCSAV